MSAQAQLKTTVRAERSVVGHVCWRSGITIKHVIVVLWFEVAVLCSKLLLYIVLGRER